jgi:hypothetical protein
MKDAYEVLKQKEADLSRVRREVESLRIVAPLLLDDLDSDQSERTHLMSTDGLLNSVPKMRTDLETTGTAGHVLSSMRNALAKKRA